MEMGVEKELDNILLTMSPPPPPVITAIILSAHWKYLSLSPGLGGEVIRLSTTAGLIRVPGVQMMAAM